MNPIDVTGLSEDGRKIVDCLVTYFDNVLKAKTELIDKMNIRIRHLESRIEKLEEVQDEACAYDRRDTLVMSGNVPPVSANENCKDIIRDLLTSRANLVIDANDISMAFRVGSKPKRQGPDKRNIIFKMVRRDLKSDIRDACKSATPDIYVNESLTPVRDKIFFVLRKAKKSFPQIIHHCRTFDGNVCISPPFDTYA